MTDRFDVVVVGGGNAGFSAAHSAVEQGAKVLLLEKASEGAAGGNSFYTAGAFRFAFDSIDDVADLLEPDKRHTNSVVPAYPASAFTADMHRVTGGKCDPVLTEVLVSRSTDTVRWLATKGIKWRLMYERQAYLSDDEWVFSGGLYVGTVDGGKGLIAQHTKAAQDEGVEIRYGAEITALHVADSSERGVTYRDTDGAEHRIVAGAVVLSAGGFESDPQRRTEHLGEGWDRALVRGTPTNTGDVLDLALAAGAASHGDWGSCHSVAWDADGNPNGGNRELTNQLTRQSYPIGIVVNVDGQRFVDEGADFRNYTYAKYGREILRQPQSRGFQLFDAKTRPLLRKEEYDSQPIASAQANTLDELAAKLGIDPDGLQRTVSEFNSSIVDKPFDPAIKDGRAAQVEPPKSNWAQALDTAPFYGYAVGCGITFTFGGVHVDETAQVLDATGASINGLYAAGEMVGGLFSGNYPGGSGLTSGAVFGRLAGASAGRWARHG
ncbi:FAD-dependent oxidoreductase [Saccharopolyspora karakumensis]|uniref:FAD-dependent oxidoreductase n=1 Tax=Saccharopolyspora karakumensis TaxID=2530386 RepID=A0A4R5BSY2_9PSEU|nr:FAD-dependent tricarballylate dehydrogenase TcuA [Saccharopolyspora karakumensis]TDD89175.1 FAD-dependent oxidoreductase [Saccharopolyspora karakumensis]